MRTKKLLALLLAACCLLGACAVQKSENEELPEGTVVIELADSGVTVDGEAADGNTEAAVYVANDIVYYESGRDFTYGEGTESDAHSAEEAAAHTVVHITKPGIYSLRGTLAAGQIAVDLGDDAEEDPQAAVTLILNGADISCTVAPAVIFYNVYECGSTDAETADKTVDTSAAGANVVIADGTVNKIKGAYVARIYQPDTVELSEDGTEVLDAKKLHKYDAAFYSKMSMNVTGGEAGTGKLLIDAANEGLDSELHLTINGGQIEIESGNDGINTNEDGISVTTINGGSVKIRVTGETGEGDGIDSNGWLVINGGTVVAAACATSGDAGIDSDMGIHINGGTVIATGHMLDRIEAGGQNHAVFNFAAEQKGDSVVSLKTADGEAVFDIAPQNACSILVFSSPALQAGTYTLWSGETQLAGFSGSMGDFGGKGDGMRPDGNFGGERPEGMAPPEGFGGGEIPEGMTPPEGFDGEWPEGMTPPDGFGRGERPEGEIPEGMTPPDGNFGGMGGGMRPDGFGDMGGELSTEFVIVDGSNQFYQIAAVS